MGIEQGLLLEQCGRTLQWTRFEGLGELDRGFHIALGSQRHKHRYGIEETRRETVNYFSYVDLGLEGILDKGRFYNGECA